MYYRVIRTAVADLEGHFHKTYGISASRTRIEDISFDKRQVVKLAGLCNRLKLDTVHLPDAVEDFLLKNCNKY